MAHPKFEIPADPHGKARYESARLHAEVAEKEGKSSEEIHAVFKKVMDFNPATDIDKIPNDEAHKKYRSALIHAIKAREAGKSDAEIHEVFEQVLKSTASCHCKAKE